MEELDFTREREQMDEQESARGRSTPSSGRGRGEGISKSSREDHLASVLGGDMAINTQPNDSYQAETLRWPAL